MEPIKLRDVLKRYNEGKSSDEEKLLIENWYAQLNLDVPDLSLQQLSELHNLQVPLHKAKTPIRLKTWVIVAATLLLIGTAVLTYWQIQMHKVPTANITQNDVLPGGNKAILKLADGTAVNLSDVELGALATQEGMLIRKDQNGTISYKNMHSDKEINRHAKNSISTPKGGNYHLVLPDGTNVWLNASSSITYPVHFANDQRVVEITGEVYFEVTANKRIPFSVKSQQQVIQVLGTQFNVNAYSDNPTIRTTLVEGAVKVQFGQVNQILKPGQQAIANQKGIRIKEVDLYAETAWKNGDFVFKNLSIRDLMKQLSRWYAIELDYTNYNEKSETFSGEIARSRNLSAVLRMLEKTNAIRFQIEGNKVHIINN